MRRGNLRAWAFYRYPDRTAYIFGDREISFREMIARSGRLCNGLLSIGLRQGHKAAVLLNNSVETLDCQGGIGRVGLTVVPLNPRHSSQEHAYVLNNSEVDAVILSADFLDLISPILPSAEKVKHVIVIGARGGEPEGMIPYEKLIEGQPETAPLLETDDDQIDRIQYTSGTTGRPKGAVSTAEITYSRMMNILINLDLPILPSDINLVVGPLAHAAGVMNGIYNIRGATNIIMSGFDEEEILKTIEREHVTSILLVPTMLIRLLMVPNLTSYDLSSLKRIWYGTAPMPKERLKQAIEIFGNIFRQNYGMTEAPQPITYLGPEDHIIKGTEEKVRRLASAGRPALGVNLRIVKEDDTPIQPGEMGEIQIQGPQLMKEYWKMPEATADAFREGWFHTGDMGTFDEEGYVFILDRKQDMIISGGFNIYPREVEDVLMAHPGVVEAAVIGIPDDVWGESVKAFVVPKEGFTITAEEIIQFCRDNIASYKKPKSVDFVQELPKNTYGKVVRKDLKTPYWKGLDRKV
jgi:acyl-CoA synthetase (AMP-forming)/AMP-acid ligase II